MAIRLQCPNCHEPVYVGADVDASTVRCPACGVDVADGEAPDDLLELAREQVREKALEDKINARADVHWSADPRPKVHHIPANSWLMKCCDCGSPVSRSADRCPHCGGDPQRVRRLLLAAAIMGVLVAMAFTIAVFSAV